MPEHISLDADVTGQTFGHRIVERNEGFSGAQQNGEVTVLT